MEGGRDMQKRNTAVRKWLYHYIFFVFLVCTGSKRCLGIYKHKGQNLLRKHIKLHLSECKCSYISYVFCILKPSCNICMWRTNFDLIPIFTAVTFFMLLKQHVVNESRSEIATSTTISWIRSYTHNQVDRHNTVNCMWIMNYFFGYCICVIRHRYYSPYSSLRQCVIRRQFACSIADEIIQIFYCIIPFGRTVASDRNEYQGYLLGGVKPTDT